MTDRIDLVTAHLRDQPRRWLVTGAAGFIGSHLVETLLDLGQEVVGLDNYSTGHRANLDDVRAQVGEPAWRRFTMVEGDIRDVNTCDAAVTGVAHVLHQAAIGSVPRSVEDPLTTHSANVDGTFNVIDAARRRHCKSVVFASSSSVYGDEPNLPKVESRLGRPLSPYAASKRSNEVLAEAFSSAYGMQVAGLRYFNVVGPRQDPEGPYAAVIPRWVRLLLAHKQPTVFGDGETSRDFCPIDNVVQINLLAAMHEELRATHPAPVDGSIAGLAFNVAVGDRTTLNELFEMLRDGLTGLGSDCSGVNADYADFRVGDIRHSQADVSLARDRLGYVPRVALREGLARTLEWFHGHRGRLG